MSKITTKTKNRLLLKAAIAQCKIDLENKYQITVDDAMKNVIKMVEAQIAYIEGNE